MADAEEEDKNQNVNQGVGVVISCDQQNPVLMSQLVAGVCRVVTEARCEGSIAECKKGHYDSGH